MTTSKTTSKTLTDPAAPSPDATLFGSTASQPTNLPTGPPEGAAVATEPKPATKARKQAKPRLSATQAQEEPVKRAKAQKPAKREQEVDAPTAAPTTQAKPGKKPSKAKGAATPEPSQPAEPSTPAPPKSSKRTAPPSMPRTKPSAPAPSDKPWLAKVSSATLGDAATGFLAAIEAEGASEATVSGYKRELAVAQAHFGADKLLALIQPHEVAAFNESPAVMVARDGAPKAEPSFMRTRRVLRLALCWAVEQGLLETAPLPAKAPRKSKEPAATAS